MDFGSFPTLTKSKLGKSLEHKIDKIESDLLKFAAYVRDSLTIILNQIEEGTKKTQLHIDTLSEKIGKNANDLDKIKKVSKKRERALIWIFEALKQSLSIILAAVTLYFLLKHGGKTL